MYREITHDDLVLMLPLSPEEQRKVEYLDDTLTDGQWEVRELGHGDATTYAAPGADLTTFEVCIDDVVAHLFAALDTVTQAKADEYAAQSEQE